MVASQKHSPNGTDGTPPPDAPALAIPAGAEAFPGPAPASIGDVNTPLVTAAKRAYPGGSGPAYGRVESVVKLDVPPYEGFEFAIWKNHPMAIEDDFFGVAEDRRVASLTAVFLSHNDWRDSEGNPLPPLSDPIAFFRAIPADLLNLMLEAMRAEARRVPDFPTKRA